MTIQSKVATILKAKLLPSEKLAATEKFSIYKGQALQVKSIAPAPHQHLVVELIDAPIARGYIYAPHWNYEQQEIILPATYYYQTDNPSGEGYRECCGTSNAILLNYLLKGKLDADAAKQGLSQPEWIYLKALREEGDTTDHDANTRTLCKFGVDSYWSTSLGFDDYFLSIRNDLPMILGTDYKAAGHIICGVGFNLAARKVIVHDPFGAREGSTNYWISNLPEAGKFDEYQIGTLTKTWMPDGRGWGRVVTHVNGVKTVFAD